MSAPAPKRTPLDRLRYTISFEFILLALLIPATAWFFNRLLLDMGYLNVIITILAMVVNYLYNLVIDTIESRTGRISSDRKLPGRILHAMGLEVVLIASATPVYMFWLDLNLLQAVSVNIAISTFVVAFTFVFTWVYDRLFPVRMPEATIGPS